MNPSSNAEDPTNPAGREIKNRRGGGESPDHRESSGGRRSSNWVGYYPLSFRQLLHIHSDSVRLVGTAILIGLIFSLGVWIVTPYVYHATGTILIDELPFIQMQKTADAETERQLVQTLILSIANRDMRVEVEKQLGLPPGRIAFNGLDRRLPLSGPEPKANVQISPVRNSRLGSISADSQSPEFAARVVNAILSDLDLYNRIGGRLKELAEKIEFVCSDMWKPYLTLIEKHCTNALNILDRFHVVAKLNKALDEVRASEARKLVQDGYEPVLKKSRWCLLKKPGNLTDNQRVKLREVLRYNLKSVRAYLYKEDFQRFWEYDSPVWAGKFLDQWCKDVMRSKIDPLKKFVGTLRNHRELLLNYFRAKKAFSSGVVEGLNNKAKVTMRKAYGYKTYEMLELSLYHVLGKLPEPELSHRFF